jgi:hypothetical protein
MTISQNIACQRLSALGISKKTKYAILDNVALWKSASGTEWTVNRLKELKLLFIKRLAGEEYQPKWISLDRNGLPKGPLKHLFMVDKQDARRVFRSLSALMVYSAEVSSKPTPNQWEKFRSSVEDGTDKSTIGFEAPAQRNRVLTKFQKRLLLVQPQFMRTVLSPSRRVPVWDTRKHGTVTVPEDEPEKWFVSNAAMLTKLGGPWNKYFTNTFDTGVADQLECIPLRLSCEKVLALFHDVDPGPPSFGKVSFIQEPGYKLRAVANPNRVIQYVLEPLKVLLGSMVSSNKRDCTFDQEKGIKVIQGWLRDKRRVHSVDLSDATNHFPLSLQISALERALPCGWDAKIRLFEEAARGPWRVLDPVLGKEREIRWTKGQPLGLGPSFFSFTYTHHESLELLREKYQGDFLVVGDDVAIVGDDLCKAYLDFLSQIECPISEHKCLHSTTIAEFAGKIISSEWALPQLKYRAVSDRNFLDVARLLGPRSLGIYPRRQREILKLVAEGPLELGGLNWNPQGIPEDQRALQFEKVRRRLQGESGPSDWVTDLTQYEDQKRVFTFALRMGITAQVESSRPLVDKTSLPVEGPSYLRNTKDKPLQGGDPRGSTTLEILERKLQDLLPQESESEPIVTILKSCPPKRGGFSL